MSWLDRLFGDDRERAATKYAGRESATEKAARKRRENHRKSIPATAAAAEAWEARDRKRSGTSYTTWD